MEACGGGVVVCGHCFVWRITLLVCLFVCLFVCLSDCLCVYLCLCDFFGCHDVLMAEDKRCTVGHAAQMVESKLAFSKSAHNINNA